MSEIVSFYDGTGTDHRGRSLAQILVFDHDELEQHHDFIQWLFPLAVPSGVLSEAPLVDESCRKAFRERAELRTNLRRALAVMLDFYGLALIDGRIEKSAGFASRAAQWLRPGNHNFLRLTRIMTSLSLLYEPTLAAGLQVCLERLYEEQPARIGPTTIRYWRTAI
jgi:Opioid growth factor receptor (OGFr) conserved region